jgi:glycosyltransferase involved in cell wall biosynthesis
MRILVFANFPPYVMGGAENQVARLVEAWLDQGNSAEVAGFGIPNRMVAVGRHAVRLHHLHVFRAAGRLGSGGSYFLSVLYFLTRHSKRFDIIYTRGLGEATISVCLAKMMGFCGLPLIACPINARGQGDVNFITSMPGCKFFMKLINRHCNGINIIAQAIKADLEKAGIAEPDFAEIPNGIPVLPLSQIDRQEGARRLLFTGRLSQQKGLDLLIQSLDELRLEGFNFVCDIVGDGPLQETLQKKIDDAALSGYANLKGPAEAHTIRELLINSDVFVMPSRYEGMSNSVLEAMEAGLPVLVTRCGGIDYYIGDQNGWTCAPDDQAALTETLRQMLLTPSAELSSMGNANREMVERQFSIENIAHNNIEFFNLVRERRGRS